MKFKVVKDSRLYQLSAFQTLVKAYKRAHPEKNKNTVQTAVGNV